MARELMSGVWVIVCDWVDPSTKKSCNLGVEGERAMFVDPTAGKDPNTHFQCGRHHGVVPQSEKPEFQLPKGHKLNEEVLRAGETKTSVEEVDDGK